MADDIYKIKFDESLHIMQLGYDKPVHLRTKNQLVVFFDTFRTICDRYKSSGRFYLIINMTNLVIEPELCCIYAQNAKSIIDNYIIPDGVARYGHQITRLTVRRAYSDHLGEDPHIFSSFAEASAHIQNLISKNKQMLEATYPGQDLMSHRPF